MKNGIDFHRVLDGRGKLIGVLDFNNMIPVRADVVQRIEIRIFSQDSAKVRHYKNLVTDQINFCQRNQAVIVAKANKLYRMVQRKNASGPLKRRCLDWKRLEELLEKNTC